MLISRHARPFSSPLSFVSPLFYLWAEPACSAISLLIDTPIWTVSAYMDSMGATIVCCYSCPIAFGSSFRPRPTASPAPRPSSGPWHLSILTPHRTRCSHWYRQPKRRPPLPENPPPLRQPKTPPTTTRSTAPRRTGTTDTTASARRASTSSHPRSLSASNSRT